MHLLYHKAMGHPSQTTSPNSQCHESTAPIPPPRLDEPGIALAPIPPTVAPPPPASSCLESEQNKLVETQNSKAKPTARPRGIGAFLLARSREWVRELDHMS